MTNVSVKRTDVNVEALDALVHSSLPGSLGVSWDGQIVTVHLSDEPSKAEIEQVRALIEQHDATRLTPRQQTEVDRKTRLEELRRANAKTLDLAVYESAPSEIRQLAEKIAWLELELAERQ